MPVTLFIDDAPDDLVRRLRDRAFRHDRSLRGELLAIVEDAVRLDGKMGPSAILAEVGRLGVRTAPDSAAIVRADRDRR